MFFGERRGREVTLLVASTGGHLEELYRLRARLSPESTDVEWVTFDDAQSRSLLAGEVRHYIPYVPPRGSLALVKNLAAADRILRSGHYSRIVTTGSGIALAFVLQARSRGIPYHYIESAARAEGPSLTGSLIARVPGVNLYCQYPAWAGVRWQYRGSVFDGYYKATSAPRAQHRAGRAVVTLGTMRTYGFRRAVEQLVRLLPDVLAPDSEVLWQVGPTDVSGLGIHAHDRVPADELKAAMAEADLVIAHAGIGSAISALDAGRCPVLLPRRHARGEHVDDHQLMIAKDLHDRQLAIARDPGDLTAEDLADALRCAVLTLQEPTVFRLNEKLTRKTLVRVAD